MIESTKKYIVDILRSKSGKSCSSNEIASKLKSYFRDSVAISRSSNLDNIVKSTLLLHCTKNTKFQKDNEFLLSNSLLINDDDEKINYKSYFSERNQNIFEKIDNYNWRLKINFYEKEIFNLSTRFYFLTTGKYDNRDFDYKFYTWNTHRNNKLKVGDIFIYRVPKKVSKNKQFYFFGAGQIEKIFTLKEDDPKYLKEGDMCAKISNSIHFSHPIYESDLIPSDLGSDRENWEHAFDQYGIEEVTLDKFLFLLNKGTGDNFKYDEEDNEIKTIAHQKILDRDFSVADSEVKNSKSRGKWQIFFRNSIVLPNYDFKCAITGIETPSLLTAAHILRWADHKDKRIDPQNGICLSKLVDKCFEDYLLFIDENYRIEVPQITKKDKELYAQLKTFIGKKIFLPKNKDYRPNKNYLRIHKEKGIQYLKKYKINS